jgi:hypothetical protein
VKAQWDGIRGDGGSLFRTATIGGPALVRPHGRFSVTLDFIF